MNKALKAAFLFPGQGAQYVGMGKDFYAQFPIARHTFEEADTFLNAPFSKCIFEGPSDELILTKNSQIAIYVVSIALWRVVQQQFPDLVPTLCAGLSLGEYTALTAAGKISFTDCLDLVRVRASAMHEACQEREGAMQVVLGMTAGAIEDVIGTLTPPQPVWIANLNCPGQVVVAGTTEALAVLAAALKEKGAKRILPLDVSGAFHSKLMRSAQEKLAGRIAAAPLQDSAVEMVMNVSGDFVDSLQEMRHMLIAQVTHPVYWEKGICKMKERSITLYLEMGPGKSLSSMNKRIGVVEPTYSVEKVADLEGLHQLMESVRATAKS